MELFDRLKRLKRDLKQAVDHAAVSATEKFVLEFGQAYVGTKRPRGFRLGSRKQCFRNATEAILRGSNKDSKDLSYVEGYAMVPGQSPFHHAWIALNAKDAVELTLKHDPLAMTFFGVPFSYDEMTELCESQEVYGFLQSPIRRAVLDLVQRRKIISQK
jgi:hypothetical protein